MEKDEHEDHSLDEQEVTVTEDEKGGSREGSPAPAASGLKWLLLAAVLVGGLWIGIRALQRAESDQADVGAPAPKGRPPATVLVASTSLEPVQERRRVVGTLRAAKRAEVATQEEGVVAEVLVDVGDEVAEGDVLARIDRRRLVALLDEGGARLTALRGVVEERRAEAARAERDLEMKRDLFSQRAVSERELLDAQREEAVAAARLRTSEDEVKASEASLELLAVRLADSEVRAPFDGRVVVRHLDPGEWVGTGGAGATLVSTGIVEAWLQVPERFLGRINSDDEAAFEIVAEAAGLRSRTLALRQVGDVDPVTRLFPVVAEIDDLEGRLAPGLSIAAEVPVGDVLELISVPVDAVIESFSGSAVLRPTPAAAGGLPVAERVPVEVAFRRDGRIFLADRNLKPGELVVVEGNERLFPGTPLLVSPREERDSGASMIEAPVKP